VSALLGVLGRAPLGMRIMGTAGIVLACVLMIVGCFMMALRWSMDPHNPNAQEKGARLFLTGFALIIVGIALGLILDRLGIK
jgi:hypothetical protein